jgi:hypothetical protein
MPDSSWNFVVGSNVWLLARISAAASMHDWLALFGRTHVVVIHFPIALLLMAALGEAWGQVRGHPAG